MSTLRAAQAGDVTAIARLFSAARSQAMPWLPDLHSAQEDQAHFGGLVRDGSTTVAEVGGVVAGFVVAAEGWVRHLYVAPEHQANGIGRQLLEHVQDAHPSGLELWVFQRNLRALGFYARHGFRELERTDGTANEEREPDVRMGWPAP